MYPNIEEFKEKTLIEKLKESLNDPEYEHTRFEMPKHKD